MFTISTNYLLIYLALDGQYVMEFDEELSPSAIISMVPLFAGIDSWTNGTRYRKL
jgi:hypothetical protein